MINSGSKGFSIFVDGLCVTLTDKFLPPMLFGSSCS